MTFVAYVSRGYWIDIGTPEKYLQVHRDIMDGRFTAVPFTSSSPQQAVIAPGVTIDDQAHIEGPCFIDQGTVVRAGARVGPYTVLGRDCKIKKDAVVEGSILWPYTEIDREAVVRDVILGRGCQVGNNVSLGPHVVLGDKSVVTGHSKVV